jgi:Protein of unknown function (DUF3168)
MPTPVLPNPKVAARTGLLAQAALTALVSTRIYYAIPANPTYPLVVLSIVDADELRPETLTARVQADVWGNGNDTQAVLDCEAIAAVIRSVARNLVGTWGGASISNAVAGQAIPQPDSTTGRARTIVDLLLDIN